MRVFLVAIAVLVWLAANIVAVFAQEPHHHPGKSPEVSRFYETWMKPDKPTESCCNKTDCDEAEARLIGGVWWAKRARDANFTRVPPEKVEQNRDSPDGRNHFCKSNYSDTAYCFIAGSGT